jgi:hypothetical protein
MFTVELYVGGLPHSELFFCQSLPSGDSGSLLRRSRNSLLPACTLLWVILLLQFSLSIAPPLASTTR